jgi:hypothetical protein
MLRVILLGCSLSLLVDASSAFAQAAPESSPAPSFLNDVLPLLTRLGCNQGACHGKGAGQNGFRLSLRGYAPEWDHDWLTREYEGRRLNRVVPEASLLLQKPLGRAPHEGGKLIAQGSRAHEVLLDWVRTGALGPKKGDPEIRGIALLPASRVMKPGEQLRLTVVAHFSDGQSRDVTWLAQFVSNDASVAEVTADGLAKMVRPGETAIRAMFMGQVAVAMLTAPLEQEVPENLFAGRNNFMDDHVFKKLAALRIEPSAACSDEVFIRRVFLDAMGVLPSAREVRDFLADQSPDKRAKLIDQVLARPEFVDYWALLLDDLLQNRKESDHDVRGAKGVRSLHEWIRDQVARDRPWDEMVRDLLTATGSTRDNPAIGYFIVTVGENREAQRSSVVASAAQTFLGIRIGCAQCHNHPLEKYTQDDYYHFAGFFSRIRLERKDPKKGMTNLVVSGPDANQDKNPVGVIQPRTGKFLAPQPLDRTAPKVEPGTDPRRVLADWITGPVNAYFAGALVNRLWAHFLGVGLVEPIDDQRASNPPSNPELWQALVNEFVLNKFDRKHLIRLTLNSRTYQLSSATKPGNERDSRFYSHYYARRLPAEVMLDAIAQATGISDQFEGYPLGVRAVQVPDPAVKSYFLGLFGRSERVTACACERNNEVTLPQLLHLRGGTTIAQKLAAWDGRLASWLKSNMSDADLIDAIFLASLGRHPRPNERAVIERTVHERGAASREEVFRDVFWAILNTKEFAFNH